MTELFFAFDLLLLISLIGLAWLLLATEDLFKAVVLFIAFGLFLSIAWTRLGAPDVALAEAAIGAGITGTLLLVGLGRLGSKTRCQPRRRPTTTMQRLSAPLLIGLIMPSITMILLLELQQLQSATPGQRDAVISLLDSSGTGHPVTAVLLNFRAYDTLLEMGVLLLALVAIWSLDKARPLFLQESVSPVLQGLTRLLLPILILVSGALLWQGGQSPGGAFQAGALLSAGIILATLSGRSLPLPSQGLTLRGLLAGGFLFFLMVTAGTLLLEGLPLNYPRESAGALILAIEIFATVSIAVLLAGAIAGGHPGEILESSSPGQPPTDPGRNR